MDPMSPRTAPSHVGPPLLTRLDLRGATGDLRRLLPAPAIVSDDERGEQTAAVRAILDRVRLEGDGAVRFFTRQFDGVAVDDLRVPDDEVKAALETIPAALRDAL